MSATPRMRRAAVLRRARALALLACLSGSMLVAGRVAAVDEEAPELPGLADTQTWFVETLAEGEHAFRISYLWSKRDLFRAETIVNGQPILTMIDGPNYYTVNLLTRKAISIERSPRALAADKTRDRPFGDELDLILKEGGEKVGTESTSGGVCDVYQRTNDTGRVRVCATQTKPRLPVKIENFNRRTARTETIRYLNWLGGLEIPDEFFRPGPDIEVEHFTYEKYLERSAVEPLGPAPPIYGYLLHGD